MEVKDRIDELIRQDMQIAKDITRTEKRFCAKTATLRQELKELGWSIEDELNKLNAHRSELRDEILKLWKENFNGEVTLILPSAMISRRNYMELVVKDKIAIVNALDRIGRLDLVDYVFKENEVARLFSEGKLEGLTEKAAKVIDRYNLQVRPTKKGA